MADKPEVIQNRIDKTRERLGEKLDQIQEKVLGPIQAVEETVEDVAEYTEETVETIGDALNVRKQVRKRPWTVMACSVAAGFFGSWAWNAMTSRTETPSSSHEPQQAIGTNGTSRGAKSHEQPEEETTFFGQIGEQLRPALVRLGKVGVESAIGVVRDTIAEDLPEETEQPVTDFINRISGQFGVESKDKEEAPSQLSKTE